MSIKQHCHSTKIKNSRWDDKKPKINVSHQIFEILKELQHNLQIFNNFQLNVIVVTIVVETLDIMDFSKVKNQGLKKIQGRITIPWEKTQGVVTLVWRVSNFIVLVLAYSFLEINRDNKKYLRYIIRIKSKTSYRELHKVLIKQISNNTGKK